MNQTYINRMGSNAEIIRILDDIILSFTLDASQHKIKMDKGHTNAHRPFLDEPTMQHWFEQELDGSRFKLYPSGKMFPDKRRPTHSFTFSKIPLLDEINFIHDKLDKNTVKVIKRVNGPVSQYLICPIGDIDSLFAFVTTYNKTTNMYTLRQANCWRLDGPFIDDKYNLIYDYYPDFGPTCRVEDNKCILMSLYNLLCKHAIYGPQHHQLIINDHVILEKLKSSKLDDVYMIRSMCILSEIRSNCTLELKLGKSSYPTSMILLIVNHELSIADISDLRLLLCDGIANHSGIYFIYESDGILTIDISMLCEWKIIMDSIYMCLNKISEAYANLFE